MSLFDLEVVPRSLTPKEKFEEFHRENPHVYRELRQLALDLVEFGHERIGIGMLFEVLRWQRALRTTDDDFKLNNNYRARYARLLMEREPRLAGKFEIRQINEGEA